MFTLNQIPIFQQLENSQNILLAGGGFDIYAGIPFYLNLLKQGKNVILGNYSFTFLKGTTSEEEFSHCYRVKGEDRDISEGGYFPEKYLAQYLATQGHDATIYAFERSGVNAFRKAYKYLIDKYKIDAVVLVDGGTDSLMFGDEEGLGTPIEDMISMSAVYQTGIEKQYLLNLGFGVDHYHGVSHFRFLENVAALSKEGAYLESFHLLPQMPEAQQYKEALLFSNERMPNMESIVSNSIVSALEGEYGDYHKTKRTQGSQLWINPLMTIYWAFDLQAVVQKIKYYDYIKGTDTVSDFMLGLRTYRTALAKQRPSKQIPI